MSNDAFDGKDFLYAVFKNDVFVGLAENKISDLVALIDNRNAALKEVTLYKVASFKELSDVMENKKKKNAPAAPALESELNRISDVFSKLLGSMSIGNFSNSRIKQYGKSGYTTKKGKKMNAAFENYYDPDDLVCPYSFTGWKAVSKTKGIKAKPMGQIIIDKKIMEMLKLQTLEGDQALKDNSMVCLGVDSEPWQQDVSNLFKKYNVVNVDQDGWLICEPKTENKSEALRITEEMCDDKHKLTIYANWGTKLENGKFSQKGKVGDYFLRNTEDKRDTYIVEKEVYERTYSDI